MAQFTAPYEFRIDGKEVVIQHKAGGDFNKYLRVKPGNLGLPDSQGGTGEFARWEVQHDGNGTKVRLRSKKTNKYLRIMGDGKINVEGGTGPLTLFKVHTQGGNKNHVKLESNQFPGKYISVKHNGDVNLGSGGPWTELKFFRDGGAFTNGYLFHVSNRIVIQHQKGNKYDKFLRVNPNKRSEADADGGKGKFAQFTCNVVEKAKKVQIYYIDDSANNEKRYLRIGPAGNINFGGNGGKWTYFKVHLVKPEKPTDGQIAKLESIESPGKYISVKPNGNINVGNGGEWTKLKFFRLN